MAPENADVMEGKYEVLENQWSLVNERRELPGAPWGTNGTRPKSMLQLITALEWLTAGLQRISEDFAGPDLRLGGTYQAELARTAVYITAMADDVLQLYRDIYYTLHVQSKDWLKTTRAMNCTQHAFDCVVKLDFAGWGLHFQVLFEEIRKTLLWYWEKGLQEIKRPSNTG